jgi:hypothetical protein
MENNKTHKVLLGKRHWKMPLEKTRADGRIIEGIGTGLWIPFDSNCSGQNHVWGLHYSLPSLLQKKIQTAV